jgi:hypothetical protein
MQKGGSMKNKQSRWLFFFVFAFISSGCIKEDFFGRSSLKQIRFFQIEKQSGNAQIQEDSLRIMVRVDANADLNRLRVDSIQLSTFATIFPSIETVRDFTQPVTYTVTAEDGSTAVYTIIARLDSPEPQLENSGFDDWFTPAGRQFQEPGLDSTSIWATANTGVTTFPLPQSNANTLPLLISGTDYAAQLITRQLGGFALAAGQGIGSATLFTGTFRVDITNPTASARIGYPFTARPTAFSVALKYTAGSPFLDGRHQPLNKIDSADIYVLLENRQDQNNIRRIGTGWYRTGTTPGSQFHTTNVPIIYGNLPSGTPVHQFPGNGLFGNANDRITHISVVFASSSGGEIFEGGVGSTLTVNNFRLVY